MSDDSTPNGDVMTGELIPASEIPGKDLSLIMPTVRKRVWTNLNLKSDDGLALAMQCRAQGGKTFEQAINTVIHLRHVYVHDWPKVDPDTGEVTMLPRIVLIDDQGESVSCASTGVMDSLLELMAGKGYGPWNPPIPVKLIQVSFKRQDGTPGRLFRLLYVPEEAKKPTPATKGRKQ